MIKVVNPKGLKGRKRSFNKYREKPAFVGKHRFLAVKPSSRERSASRKFIAFARKRKILDDEIAAKPPEIRSIFNRFERYARLVHHAKKGDRKLALYRLGHLYGVRYISNVVDGFKVYDNERDALEFYNKLLEILKGK